MNPTTGKDESSAAPVTMPGISGGQQSAESELSSNLFRVGVKIPPFWPEDPELWFARLEGQFTISNIKTDSTKFYYAISQMDFATVAEVRDVIKAPPAENKYEMLKTCLISRLTESHEKKIKQLLVHEELGDRKPSQFLRHLQALAGPTVPDDFLKTIWSSRLPSNIQTIIASQAETPLESLATLADRIHEVAVSTTPFVAATSFSPMTSYGSSTSCPTSWQDNLCRQVAELTKQVAALTVQQQSRSRNNQRGNFRSRTRSRSQSRSRQHNDKYCWYHNVFGAKAFKCSGNCTYKTENSSSSR